MSEVNGPVRRASLGLDSFADLTDVPLLAIRRDGLTFGGELTEQEAADVWSRMESVDDADQARREALRCADGATNLAEMVRAYVLGDLMPDPIYPAAAPVAALAKTRTKK